MTSGSPHQRTLTRPSPASAATVRPMPLYRVREAAQLLGVSDDTVRRCAESGRVEAVKDAAGRTVIYGAALAQLAEGIAAAAPGAAAVPGVRGSPRERLIG